MQKDIISLTVPPCFRKCPFYTLKTRSRPFFPPKLPKGAFLVIFEVSKIALSVKDQITPKHENINKLWLGEENVCFIVYEIQNISIEQRGLATF